MRTLAITAFIVTFAACSEAPEELALDEQSLPLVAAPGSAEPYLASAPDGRVVMSWLEPLDGGTALRYAVLEDGAWSAAITVAQGDDWFVNWADFPSLALAPDGTLAAHWLAKVGDDPYAYGVRRQARRARERLAQTIPG